MNIHLIGKPCSGKALLTEHLRNSLAVFGCSIYYVGTGEAIRKKIAADEKFRKLCADKVAVRAFLDDGHLWQVVMELIQTEKIPYLDPNVVILWDCVLRNAAQVRRMNTEGILDLDDLVLHLNASDNTTRNNLALRQKRLGRTDDNPEAHSEGVRRYNAHHREVTKAIDESGATLRIVNANLPSTRWLAIAEKAVRDHFMACDFSPTVTSTFATA